MYIGLSRAHICDEQIDFASSNIKQTLSHRIQSVLFVMICFVARLRTYVCAGLHAFEIVLASLVWDTGHPQVTSNKCKIT